MPLPQDIIDKVRKDFCEAQAQPVLELLSELQNEEPEWSSRILRCIVFLAKGDFEEFARAVALARLDWRDLILAAEYDGWAGEECKRRNLNDPFTA